MPVTPGMRTIALSVIIAQSLEVFFLIRVLAAAVSGTRFVVHLNQIPPLPKGEWLTIAKQLPGM